MIITIKRIRKNLSPTNNIENNNDDKDKRSVENLKESYFYLCEAIVLREHLIWKIPGVWEAALDEGKITIKLKFHCIVRHLNF